MATIGEMLRMDEGGRFTRGGSGRTIAEELAPPKGQPAKDGGGQKPTASQSSTPSAGRTKPRDDEDDDGQVTLVCRDGSLGGYYARWQARDMPERMEPKGNTIRLLEDVSYGRRFALLRRSYDNPGLTTKQRKRVRKEVDDLVGRHPGLRRVLSPEEQPQTETPTPAKSPASKARSKKRPPSPKPTPSPAPKRPTSPAGKKASSVSDVANASPRRAPSRARPAQYVTRDENGCFLGVFTQEDARAIWPDAEVEGGVIQVPHTVDFATAADTITRSKSLDTTFSQERYKESVAQAFEFVRSLATRDVSKFWEKLSNTKLKVYNYKNTPVAYLLPRFIDEAVGHSWFLTSESSVQLMPLSSGGAVRKACKRAQAMQGDAQAWQGGETATAAQSKNVSSKQEVALEKAQLEKLGRSLRRGSFVVLATDGSIAYICGKRRKRSVRPHVLSMLPEDSYTVTEWGLQLTRSLASLGYGDATDFADACAAVGGSGASGGGTQPHQHPAHQDDPSASSPTDEVTFDGPDRILFIFKGVLPCLRRGHHVEAATGTIATLSGRPAIINVNYCHECRQYYLGQREYVHYREVHGPILGNFSFPEPASGSGAGSLSQESPLMMCGYNVREDEGLSSRERQLILANIMDRGILSKPRIIEYLQFFISWRESNPSMRNACQKWRDDLSFVRGYRIDRQRRFAIGGVMPNR